jgi:hypothetical protein
MSHVTYVLRILGFLILTSLLLMLLYVLTAKYLYKKAGADKSSPKVIVSDSTSTAHKKPAK